MCDGDAEYIHIGITKTAAPLTSMCSAGALARRFDDADSGATRCGTVGVRAGRIGRAWRP